MDGMGGEGLLAEAREGWGLRRAHPCQQGVGESRAGGGNRRVQGCPGREGSSSPKLDPGPSTSLSLFPTPFEGKGKEGRKESLLKSCFPSCWENNT